MHEEESSWSRGSQFAVAGINDYRDRGDATRLDVGNVGLGSRSDRVHLFGIWGNDIPLVEGAWELRGEIR